MLGPEPGIQRLVFHLSSSGIIEKYSNSVLALSGKYEPWALVNETATRRNVGTATAVNRITANIIL
jgi:hypothetical protein